MMHGFLKFITGNSPEAREMRKKFVFKIVPMINPDGVIGGNYRSSFSGSDLNR
jgi:murein tripeptide amidase MpaA